MENQPTQPSTTGRQWFRLASLARLESLRQAAAPAPNQTTAAPAPAPAPASATMAPPRPVQAAFPRIPLPRPPSERFPGQPLQPTIQQAQQAPPSTTANGAPLAQAQPEPKQQATPPPLPAVSSQPAVPQTLQSPPPPSPRSRVPSREPTPPQSPKVVKPSSPIRPESPKIQQLQPIKTPPESPKFQQLPPIKTPPPYPEPEPKPLSSPSPKSTFIQQGNNNEDVKTIAGINGKPLVNSNRSHVEARAPSPSPKKETAPNETGMATAWKKKDDNGEVKIITMAGENTGAYMELGSLHGQHANRKQQYGYQLQYHRTTSSSESQSEDGKSDDKKKDKGKKSTAEGKPIAALVNSNVQSINNSILFGSSSTKQSPGVHFTLVSQRHAKHEGSTHR